MTEAHTEHTRDTASHETTTSGGVTGSEQKKVEHNTLMAALAYVGPLVLVPYFTTKDDAFVKYHIRQGLVLLVLWIASWILTWWLGMLFYMLMPIIQLLNLGLIVLSVIGIVHSVRGEQKELPLVGGFAVHFKI